MLLRGALGTRAVLNVRGQQQGLAANRPTAAARAFLVLPGAVERARARPEQHGIDARPHSRTPGVRATGPLLCAGSALRAGHAAGPEGHHPTCAGRGTQGPQRHLCLGGRGHRVAPAGRDVQERRAPGSDPRALPRRGALLHRPELRPGRHHVRQPRGSSALRAERQAGPRGHHRRHPEPAERADVRRARHAHLHAIAVVRPGFPEGHAACHRAEDEPCPEDGAARSGHRGGTGGQGRRRAPGHSRRANAHCLPRPRLVGRAPGETIESVLGFKTAETAAGLTYLRCNPGLDLSRDELLNEAAAARGIPTDILETQVDVDRRRKAVPPGYYATILVGAFAPDVEEKYQAVVGALNIGDYDAALKASQADPSVVEDVETFNRLMLFERNKAWLAPLQQYLDEGNAVIVVGTAHWPGDGGLLKLLQGRGYVVKHIHIDADQ